MHFNAQKHIQQKHHNCSYDARQHCAEYFTKGLQILGVVGVLSSGSLGGVDLVVLRIRPLA